MTRDDTAADTDTDTATRATEPQGARPSLGRQVRVELRKALDTRTVLLVLGVALLLRLGIHALDIATGDSTAEPLSTLGMGGELTRWVAFSVLLASVVGVLTTTPEWTAPTASSTFVLTPRRTVVGAAKLAAAAVLALGLWALELVIAATAHGVRVASGAQPDWAVHPGVLLGTALPLVLSALAAVGWALLTRSTLAAVALALGLPVAWSLAVFTFPVFEGIAPWVTADYGAALLTSAWPAGEATGTEVAQALTSTALWAGAPLVAGWYRLTRTDLV